MSGIPYYVLVLHPTGRNFKSRSSPPYVIDLWYLAPGILTMSWPRCLLRHVTWVHVPRYVPGCARRHSEFLQPHSYSACPLTPLWTFQRAPAISNLRGCLDPNSYIVCGEGVGYAGWVAGCAAVALKRSELWRGKWGAEE